MPLNELLARREDLTKGWMLALIEVAPLEQAGSILTADLAREGPRLCEAVLRGLVDDEGLRELEPGGRLDRLAAQAGDLAGAGDAAAAMTAIDALGSVIWTAVRESLEDPDPDRVARLAERLTVVVGAVRAAAVRAATARAATVRGAAVRAYSGGAGAARPQGPAVSRGGPAGPAEGHRGGWPDPAERFRGVPADPPERFRGVPADPPERFRGVPADPPERFRGVPADPPGGFRGGPSAPATTGAPGPLEPVGDELWIRALDEEITLSHGAGMGLSLLLVELEEAERMRTVATASEIGASFGQFAQAMRSALRRRDILACESDTRAWIVARDTMRSGAQALGGRIAGAVQAAEPWRGAPLAVSIGVAVLGEDGQDRDALMGAAEQDRFAAAASGSPVLGGIIPPESDEEDPSGWAE